jgi:hypothetical protein
MSGYSEYSQPSSTGSGARGRGHSRSRKKTGHTHARGRYRGGLVARCQERSAPEGEQSDEAEAAELEARYASRTVGSNADRYEELESEIGLDGMDSIEPYIVIIV